MAAEELTSKASYFNAECIDLVRGMWGMWGEGGGGEGVVSFLLFKLKSLSSGYGAYSVCVKSTRVHCTEYKIVHICSLSVPIP